MKILQVVEALGGGLFEVVRQVSEGAVKAGHHVAIAYGVRPETPDIERSAIDPRIELFPCWSRRSLTAQVAAFRTLRRLVSQWDPDVVHAQSSFAGVVGSLALSRRTPTVYSPQAYASAMSNIGLWRREAFRLAERFVSRRVTVVGACSQSEGEYARTRVGARNVVVIPNGIPELDDQELFERELPESPRVVAVGRLVPQRQPRACARILDAVSDLAEVVWIGGGDRSSDGWRALVDVGVEPTGWVERSFVLEELRSASIYLHWTAGDGFPLSVLEAMAADAVVVATDIPPNRELLGAEQVCPREEDAIALIRRILRDSELARRLRADQRDRRSRHGANQMVNGWLELYERMAPSRSTSALAPGKAHAGPTSQTVRSG